MTNENGNKLQDIMYEKDLTYRKLSRMSGISASTICDIANHDTDPKQSTMIAISRALGMSVENVFNLDWRKKG